MSDPSRETTDPTTPGPATPGRGVYARQDGPPARCSSCSLLIPPGEAMPSPVPGRFPVLCGACADVVRLCQNWAESRAAMRPRWPTGLADDPDVLLATCH